MTDSNSKPIDVPPGHKVAQVVVNHISTGPGAASLTTSNAIAIINSRTSSVDGVRKKGSFLITKVDRTSDAIAAEYRSDSENECNDNGIFISGESPGSSSVVSEAGTIDGGSLKRPLNVARAPPPTPAGATPTASPAWPSSQNQRPGITAVVSASSAVAGAAALLTAAANIDQQSSQQQRIQQAVVIASQPNSAPPATINREASASSRFHIIKIDTGPYKRGRWNCRDFDESASSSSVRSDMITVGPRSGSSSNSSGRASYHIVSEENGHVAGDQTLLLLNGPSISDHHIPHQPNAQHGAVATKPPLPPGHLQSTAMASNSHHLKSSTDSGASNAATSGVTTAAPSKENINSKHPPSASQQSTNVPSLPNVAQQQSRQRSQSPSSVSRSAMQTHAPAGLQSTTTVSRFQVKPANLDLNNAAAAILDSIVGSMQQHDTNRLAMGAVTSRQEVVTIASPTTNGPVATGATSVQPVSDGPITTNGNVGTGQAAAASVLASGSVGANVVAIDNKIEQAMDLVKTHLLYAVREEVEVLKEKIVDLEKKVFRLETENKLLREYAPPEILQQIQHQHHPAQPNSGVPNAVPVVQSAIQSSSTIIQQTVQISQQQQPVHSSATVSASSQQLAQGSANTNSTVQAAGSTSLSTANANH